MSWSAAADCWRLDWETRPRRRWRGPDGAILLAGLLGCISHLTGPAAGERYPDAVADSIGAWEGAVGPVSDGCAALAAELHVIELPRERTEYLCRQQFVPGKGACLGLFSDGWRTYVAEDNANVEGSVTHELLHLLSWCEGHPLGLDHGHCGEAFAAQGHRCVQGG